MATDLTCKAAVPNLHIHNDLGLANDVTTIMKDVDAGNVLISLEMPDTFACGKKTPGEMWTSWLWFCAWGVWLDLVEFTSMTPRSSAVPTEAREVASWTEAAANRTASKEMGLAAAVVFAMILSQRMDAAMIGGSR
eukprot:CAMPEP_0178430930 /NCGR_PEP_ID=MMETSP0689_2-20121128/31574_1 /TAXON_ID=160604 /ORGANISM="Amphidinium massartii, Strain CS-259" /LENGTH=135 /DNA_ID=CAMNT_0020052803 /DNA_START=43 /DNA_END=451 /DNA_ORIENTATION=-